MSDPKEYVQLRGISASPGVAIGKALLYTKETPPIRRRKLAADQLEREGDRFLETLHQAGDAIRRTRRMVASEQGEDLAQIFDVQLGMIEDPQIKQQTLDCIRQKSCSAEWAFSLTLKELKKRFEQIEDNYLRQRLNDVVDIEQQVLARLTGGEPQGIHTLRSNTIVVAHDLVPSESVQFGHRLLKGIVLDVGGPTSHVAIIVRSLGLPTVLGTRCGTREIASGDLVIIDGNEGVVHVRPPDEAVRQFRSQLRRQLRRERDLGKRRSLPAVTQDGTSVTLMANIDIPAEVQLAIDNGARGVGMYRTEFLYLNYRLPSEEEQLTVYRKIVEGMAPRSVTIRTIDLGGDKLSYLLDTPPEANPFLGWRGIRICLDMPDLFKTQLRALLRAGIGGNLRILLPMVSNLDELRKARAILEETKAELRREGQEFSEDCPLGVMVEVPSVALMADQFAQEAEFFSLGTNDLIQYTLAVDRSASKVATLYDSFNPAVLQLISRVADSGRRHGVEVSICGELAGNPLATGLLLGLGIESLSMSPALIPEVKEVIRSLTSTSARALADHCLTLKTGACVRACLEKAAER